MISINKLKCLIENCRVSDIQCDINKNHKNTDKALEAVDQLVEELSPFLNEYKKAIDKAYNDGYFTASLHESKVGV